MANQRKKKRGSRKASRSKSGTKSVAKPNVSSSIKERGTDQKAYQIVSKKGSEKKQEDKVSISKYVNIVTQFLRESRMELRKVKWPTRKELMAATAMVIFLVIAIAFFLGLIDFGLIKIIKKIVG